MSASLKWVYDEPHRDKLPAFTVPSFVFKSLKGKLSSAKWAKRHIAPEIEAFNAIHSTVIITESVSGHVAFLSEI